LRAISAISPGCGGSQLLAASIDSAPHAALSPVASTSRRPWARCRQLATISPDKPR